jgi:hypothetical protein
MPLFLSSVKNQMKMAAEPIMGTGQLARTAGDLFHAPTV